MNLRTLLAAIGLCPALALAASATLPQYMHDKSLGVATCANSLCHGSIEPWQNSRVLQNEYITWSRSDKHARAYSVLLNARSQNIVRKLGLKTPAQRTPLCLDCHAYNVPAAQRGEQFVLADGVTCEACHGPAGRWIASHVEPGATHAMNLRNGLFPLTEPAERARLCLSCHFGTAQKFVTHRIMAAGHPRLSFELDTFTQLQPPHYRAAGVWQGVRLWALGQTLAASELLDLLSDPQRGRDGLFPELVLFDCHACHHPMSDQRNAGGRLGIGPGVVRLNDANLIMARQIARRVDAASERQLAQQIGQLHRAIMGGDDALTQARNVQQTLSALVPKISAYTFSAEDLRGMFNGLIDDGLTGQYSDYQGAEQAVMALESVADFMSRRGLLRAQSVRPALARLLSLTAEDEKYQAARFQQALRELKSGFDQGAMR